MCLGCIAAVFALIGACIAYVALWFWRRPRWIAVVLLLFVIAWVVMMRYVPCPSICQ